MVEQVRDNLRSMADPAYRAFHSKLIPTVDPQCVLGVRVPQLRKYAKELYTTTDIKPFLKSVPHKFYEENNLHAFLIEQIEDIDACLKALEAFLPFVDNWATCDSMRPKCLKKEKEKLLPYVDKWLQATHTYTVRYGIQVLMLYYLEEAFEECFLEKVSRISRDEYYVKMMIAWYFATALAKQWKSAVVYLEERRLPLWIHNKTIQKAMESFRITAEQKNYLKSLKAV